MSGFERQERQQRIRAAVSTEDREAAVEALTTVLEQRNIPATVAQAPWPARHIAAVRRLTADWPACRHQAVVLLNEWRELHAKTGAQG